MADIASVDETAGEEAIVRGILRRASKSLNIDRECYPDDALESRVFEEAVRQQADQLKKQLEGMSDEQQEEFAERVGRQIAQLVKTEQDAVKQAMGADNMRVKEIIVGDGAKQVRHILVRNPKEAERQRAHREQVPKKLEFGLAQIKNLPKQQVPHPDLG